MLCITHCISPVVRSNGATKFPSLDFFPTISSSPSHEKFSKESTACDDQYVLLAHSVVNITAQSATLAQFVIVGILWRCM